MVTLAKNRTAEGRYVDALQLTGAALVAEPGHPGATALRLAILRVLEDQSVNFNERAWLRHARKLLEDGASKD